MPLILDVLLRKKTWLVDPDRNQAKETVFLVLPVSTYRHNNTPACPRIWDDDPKCGSFFGDGLKPPASYTRKSLRYTWLMPFDYDLMHRWVDGYDWEVWWGNVQQRIQPCMNMLRPTPWRHRASARVLANKWGRLQLLRFDWWFFSTAGGWCRDWISTIASATNSS